MEGDFLLVTEEEFTEGEKPSLHWRGRRHIFRVINDNMYHIEDLRNELVREVRVFRLIAYHDTLLTQEAIMPHVLMSKTRMVAERLMGLLDKKSGLMVHVPWRGLLISEGTIEPTAKLYEDVLGLFRKLLCLKNTQKHLVEKGRRELKLDKTWEKQRLFNYHDLKPGLTVLVIRYFHINT